MKKITLLFVTSALFVNFSVAQVISTCSISINPPSATICMGNCVTLTAVYQSPAFCNNVAYSWTPPMSLSNPNISNPVACPFPIGPTTYTVVGICLSTGCSDTASVTVNVVPPSPAQVTGPDTICLGTSATLCATGCMNYSWMPGGQTSSCIVVSPSVSTVYALTCTDINGCSSSSIHPLNVINCPTDVSESHFASDIEIFPNPFSNYFNIQVKNNAILPFEIRIYDLLGKEVKSIFIRNPEVKIYREKLLPGMYLYKIFRSTNSIGSGKIVVE